VPLRVTVTDFKGLVPTPVCSSTFIGTALEKFRGKEDENHG
jgi:hypothetical protein